MAKKQEIKDYLKHSGFDKASMKQYWNVCAENHVHLPRVISVDLDDDYVSEESADCAVLKQDGVKWKMLPIDIITALPELAEPYLHTEQTPTPPNQHTYVNDAPMSEDPHIPSAEEIAIHPISSPTYQPEISAPVAIPREYTDVDNLTDFERRILNKLDSGEVLDEDELSKLAEDYADYHKRKYGENGRWTRPVYDIIQLGNRYYSLTWYEELTEYQENSFFNQPERVYPTRSLQVIEEVNYISENRDISNVPELNEVKETLENNGYNISNSGTVTFSSRIERARFIPESDTINNHNSLSPDLQQEDELEQE